MSAYLPCPPYKTLAGGKGTDEKNAEARFYKGVGRRPVDHEVAAKQKV